VPVNALFLIHTGRKIASFLKWTSRHPYAIKSGKYKTKHVGLTQRLLYCMWQAYWHGIVHVNERFLKVFISHIRTGGSMGRGDISFIPDGFEKSCKSAIGRSNVMRLYWVCLLKCNVVKGKIATFREKTKGK
jgi:hypothetical protein